MSTVLVTGYEGFGNTPVNPAERVTRRLDGAVIDGARIVAPVDYLLGRIQPDVVLTPARVTSRENSRHPESLRLLRIESVH